MRYAADEIGILFVAVLFFSLWLSCFFTVIATSTRLFQGRVVADTAEKKGESLLGSTPLVVLSTILGRFPTIEEYKSAVEGIDLTNFVPPKEDMSTSFITL